MKGKETHYGAYVFTRIAALPLNTTCEENGDRVEEGPGEARTAKAM